MTRDEAKRELGELRGLLGRYQHEYYVAGRPSVADIEYDRLFDRLVCLEREFPDFVCPDSPSMRVGSDLDADFPEVEHRIPVLSLDKAYTAAQVWAWMNKSCVAAGRRLSFMMEEKIDGISLVLYYEDGVLARAVTRGNGFVGNDVSSNARTIREIPLRVERPGRFAVRGEVYLPVGVFEGLNAGMQTPYANPRNLAGGTLRRNKSSETAKVPLRIFVYEGFFEEGPGYEAPESHTAVMEELRRLGFAVNPRNVPIPAEDAASEERVAGLIGDYAKARAGLSYQIDGLVFKVDEIGVRGELGFTGHHPRWAIAFKFESPEGLTRVLKIEVQVGRTGRVTPVARVEPVEIGGATIENITLHNQDYINALELSEGDLVAASRRGDVIPAVERVIEKNGESPLWRMPDTCPSCGAGLVDRGAHRFCPNTEACPQQCKGRLIFFAAKDQMNIENLGGETIEFLWNEGMIRDIPDLYRIPYEKLEGCAGFGKRKVELIRQGIEKSRAQPFEVTLPSLGIPEVGTKVTEILIENGFDSVDKLFDIAARNDAACLLSLYGIGEKTAQRIIEEFSRPETRTLVNALQAEGLSFAAEKKKAAPDAPRTFAGQTWCVTGSFEGWKPRDLAMEEVKKRGGKVVSAVSGNLTHLLAGEKAGGSKLDKAKKLGVTIVTEAEFRALLDNSP
ncbi:MAG: NAD-dependent DNA ligase LigA [Spirochaetales bacterium]|jgi:DNA ligase (NAD+)|nr:NAD-dependent DNA ligase LigA [Spirochaetales bacterium]